MLNQVLIADLKPGTTVVLHFGHPFNHGETVAERCRVEAVAERGGLVTFTATTPLGPATVVRYGDETIEVAS